MSTGPSSDGEGSLDSSGPVFGSTDSTSSSGGGGGGALVPSWIFQLRPLTRFVDFLITLGRLGSLRGLYNAVVGFVFVDLVSIILTGTELLTEVLIVLFGFRLGNEPIIGSSTILPAGLDFFGPVDVPGWIADRITETFDVLDGILVAPINGVVVAISSSVAFVHPLAAPVVAAILWGGLLVGLGWLLFSVLVALWPGFGILAFVLGIFRRFT